MVEGAIRRRALARCRPQETGDGNAPIFPGIRRSRRARWCLCRRADAMSSFPPSVSRNGSTRCPRSTGFDPIDARTARGRLVWSVSHSKYGGTDFETVSFWGSSSGTPTRGRSPSGSGDFCVVTQTVGAPSPWFPGKPYHSVVICCVPSSSRWDCGLFVPASRRVRFATGCPPIVCWLITPRGEAGPSFCAGPNSSICVIRRRVPVDDAPSASSNTSPLAPHPQPAISIWATGRLSQPAGRLAEGFIPHHSLPERAHHEGSQPTPI